MNNSFFDPLYKKYIFPNKELFGVTAPPRDEIEVVEEGLKAILFDKKLLKIAMRTAGGVAGIINLSAFYSKLEHAFGVLLLAKSLIRRIKVESEKQILYRFLKDKTKNREKNSYVDDFIVALFLRGLFFSVFDDIKSYIRPDLHKEIFSVLMSETEKYIKNWREAQKWDLDDKALQYMLGGSYGEKENEVPEEIECLKQIFFYGGILDLNYLDKTLRTAFYTGAPLGRTLVSIPLVREQQNTLDTLNFLFSHLMITYNEEKRKYSVTIINKEVVPIAKEIIGSCRDLSIKIGRSGMGYISLIANLINDPDLLKKDEAENLLLNGPIDYFLNNADDGIFEKPDLIVLRGRLKNDIDINQIKNQCEDVVGKKGTVNILKGKFITDEFMCLDENTNEYSEYREFCLSPLTKDAYIILNKKCKKKLMPLTAFLAEHGDIWFDSYTITKP